MSDIKQENRDYMLLGSTMMTPSQVKGRFDSLSKRYLNLPLIQTPIVRESDRVIHPENLSWEERQQLDYGQYDLEAPQDERRFRSKFEYYENMLLALRSNISAALNLKRQIIDEENDVIIEKKKVYARSVAEYGREMGTSDKAREAWMWYKYPALCEIVMLYKAFAESVDVELTRLDAFQRDTSRALSSLETDVKVQNLSSAYKSGV